jgi:hypothetical protein
MSEAECKTLRKSSADMMYNVLSAVTNMEGIKGASADSIVNYIKQRVGNIPEEYNLERHVKCALLRYVDNGVIEEENGRFYINELDNDPLSDGSILTCAMRRRRRSKS